MTMKQLFLASVALLCSAIIVPVVIAQTNIIEPRDTLTTIPGTLGAAKGGTGVANNAAATLTRSGNHALTITTTGTTGVTFPTSGTLATDAGVSGTYLPLAGGTLTGVTALNLNSGALPTAISGTTFRTGAADGAVNRIVAEAFASIPAFNCRRANTTAIAPSALALNDVICTFGAFGYGATGYSAGARNTISMFAAEAWSDTAQGTYGTLNATPLTTAGGVEILRWDGTTVTVASGKALKLGNTYAVGVTVPTGSLEITDAAGNVYLISAVLKP